MRRPSGRVPEQPLTHMWERHNEVARRLALGERQTDIAQEMGFSKSRLSIISNSPLMKERVSELSSDRDEATGQILRQLEDMRPAAIRALKDTLENDESLNQSLRVRVAETVLDRTGLSPKGGPGGSVSISLEQYVSETLSRLRPEPGRVLGSDEEAGRVTGQLEDEPKITNCNTSDS
jgi:hypothetical protein